jgi:hypothetical protein
MKAGFMKFGLITLAALALGGVVYAGSPSTRPSASGSCCGMDTSNTKMDMSCGTGCTMGGSAPTSQPTGGNAK